MALVRRPRSSVTPSGWSVCERRVRSWRPQTWSTSGKAPYLRLRSALSLGTRRVAFTSRGGGAILAGWWPGLGTRFVGRAGELAQLERALDAAQGGHGATATVAGDAGIGKTRLVSEVATRARAQGFEVLIGRSVDLVGTDLPYQPFVEALRPAGDLVRGRREGGRLTAAGVRADARDAERSRRRGAAAARARGSALGGRVDARSRTVPGPQRARTARFAAGDIPRRGPLVYSPHAAVHRRRPPFGVGAGARTRAARARRAGRADRRARRRPVYCGADRSDRGALGGEPVLRRGASGCRRRGERRATDGACAICSCSGWTGFRSPRWICCGWPPRPDAR